MFLVGGFFFFFSLSAALFGGRFTVVYDMLLGFLLGALSVPGGELLPLLH